MFFVAVLIAVLKNKDQEPSLAIPPRQSEPTQPHVSNSPSSNEYEDLRAMIEELRRENAKLKSGSPSLRSPSLRESSKASQHLPSLAKRYEDPSIPVTFLLVLY